MEKPTESQKTDFEILMESGNIGLYQSCEVTQIFLMPGNHSPLVNIFTLIVFQDNQLTRLEESFLGTRISFDALQKVGIKQYELSISEAAKRFDRLIVHKGWDDKLKSSTLRPIPKQYIPSHAEVPLNNALKNNFDGGSYILEFFDEEKKEVASLLEYKVREKFDQLCDCIGKQIPINLAGLRDRVGNIIFQFPITIVDISTSALSSWTGVHLNFAWNGKLTTIPDCIIQLDAMLDGNLMGHIKTDYNKQEQQSVDIRNLEGKTYVRVERKSPDLILTTFDGFYIRDFNFDQLIINNEPRIFEIDGRIERVQVSSAERRQRAAQEKRYESHIRSRLYENDLARLRQNLRFKQYGRGTTHEEGINDIRELIRRNEKIGVYLWDPFLSANDILHTLYYSSNAGIALRAITGLKTVKEEGNGNEKLKSRKHKLIAEYRELLQNPANNNFGLNLEFRCRIDQHGWAFHDRFLIFPGNSDHRAVAYSLGTSVNSFGKEHHILQEVSNPQRIADAFEELWIELNHQDCIVWKSQ